MMLRRIKPHGRATHAKSRIARRATVAFLALLTGLLVAQPASAIDYVNAGSASKGPYKVSYALGVEYYSLTFSNSWSWSAGSSTTSKISNVRGSATSSANLTNQTSNTMGPVDSSRNPISSSTRYGSAMTSYSFMQSRGCLIQQVSFVCSPWTWHRGHATLHSGGTWSPTGDY